MGLGKGSGLRARVMVKDGVMARVMVKHRVTARVIGPQIMGPQIIWVCRVHTQFIDLHN